MTEKSYYDTHNATLDLKTGEWEHYEIDDRGRCLPLKSTFRNLLVVARTLFVAVYNGTQYE